MEHPCPCLHLVEMIFQPLLVWQLWTFSLTPCKSHQGVELEIPSPFSYDMWLHCIFRVISLLSSIKVLFRTHS